MAPTTSPHLDLEATPALRASVNRSAGSPTFSQYSRSSPGSSGGGSPLRNEIESEGGDSIILTEGDLLDSQDWMSPARPQLLSFEATLLHSNMSQLAGTVDQIHKIVQWLQRDAKQKVTGKSSSKLGEIDSSVSEVIDDIINHRHTLLLKTILQAYGSELAAAHSKDRLTANAGVKLTAQVKTFFGRVRAAAATTAEKTSFEDILGLDETAQAHLYSRLVRKFVSTTASKTSSAVPAGANAVAAASEALEESELDGLLKDQFSLFKASLGDKVKLSTRKGKNTLKLAQDFKAQLVAAFSADDHPVLDIVGALDDDALQLLFLKQAKSTDPQAQSLSKKRAHSSERTGGESPTKKQKGLPMFINSDDDFDAEGADDV